MSSGGGLLIQTLAVRAVLLLLLAATGSSLLLEDSSSSLSVLLLEDGSLEVEMGRSPMQCNAMEGGWKGWLQPNPIGCVLPFFLLPKCSLQRVL